MGVCLPKAALDQHVAILGKTGSGKSYCAKGIVEHLLDEKRQVCILDPTGAWSGLRLMADGKTAGYTVALLGGKNADISLSPTSGAAVARLVTKQHANVVVDTTGFTVGEYTRWFIDFAGALYTTIREPLHLVIDEAHYFMPQGRVPDVEAGKMLHAGNRLMSGGRSLGIRGMLITQRPAKLHKDALSCADTLIALRVIAPQDRQAIKDWIDGAGDAAQGKAVLNSLAQLQRGEGWVWYPEDGHLKRLRFPAIKTYDSSATPKHGARERPVIGEIRLDEIRAALADAVRDSEANDPKPLRRRIAELEKQLRAMERQMEMRVSGPSEAEILERIAAEPLSVALNRIQGIAQDALKSRVTGGMSICQPSGEAKKVNMSPAASGTPAAPKPNGAEKIAPTTRKILDVIHRSHPVALSFEAAAARAAVSRRSSQYRLYRQQVEASLEVVQRADGKFASAPGCATDIGPGIDPIAEFSAKLPPSFGRMLQVVAAAGGALTKDEIAERAGVSPTSSGLNAGLKELIALGLAERDGERYRLHEDLR